VSLLFLGLDAGGSKTALMAEGGPAPRSFTGPGVNLRRDGLDRTAAVLEDLIREALGAHPGQAVGGICAGVAGADDGSGTLSDALARRLGFDAPLLVTHDADLALQAAFGDGSGVVVIAGTGSVVVGRTTDTDEQPSDILRAGGWGYRLGDDASGTALGRAALRAAAAAFDGGPPTALTEALAEAHGLDALEALLDWTYADDGDFARLAPLFLAAAEAEDWVASSILLRETNALAVQAAWLATRADGRIEKRAALLGGLTHEATYRTSLLAALERHLPDWRLSVCETEPVAAAVRMARRLAATASGSAG